MHRPFGSVRVRTTVFATVVVAGALAVGAVALVLLQRNSMIASVDQTTQTHATDLATLVRTGALPTSVAAGKQEDSFVQVVDAHGRVVAASDNVQGEPAALRVGATTPTISTQNVTTLDGQFRIAAHRTGSPIGPVVVYVGQTLSPVQDATSGLIALLGIGAPLLLLIVAGTAWLDRSRPQARRGDQGRSGRHLRRRAAPPSPRFSDR